MGRTKIFLWKKILQALDKDKFEWSIFLKANGECIGQINAHFKDGYNLGEKNVGWYIDPKYQGRGYGTQAAKAMFDYMFLEVKIDAIKTGAAVVNPASWKIMEKLGLSRDKKTHYANYTFIDDEIEAYSYTITKDEYTKKIEDSLW